MVFDGFRIAAAVALRVGQEMTQLRVGEALPDHWIVRRRKAPARRARRCVFSSKIVILMTCAALHRRRTLTVWTATHIHDVRVQIIALPRVVSAGMADKATRMMQHGQHGLKGCDAVAPSGSRVVG